MSRSDLFKRDIKNLIIYYAEKSNKLDLKHISLNKWFEEEQLNHWDMKKFILSYSPEYHGNYAPWTSTADNLPQKGVFVLVQDYKGTLFIARRAGIIRNLWVSQSGLIKTKISESETWRYLHPDETRSNLLSGCPTR